MLYKPDAHLSGRSTERTLLDTNVTNKNAIRLEQLITSLLQGQIKVRNNLSWYAEMNALVFLRDVGKHFRIGTMLAKETVKSRLGTDDGEGLSYTEFSYMMLQAYDFWHLSEYEGCNLQVALRQPTVRSDLILSSSVAATSGEISLPESTM